MPAVINPVIVLFLGLGSGIGQGGGPEEAANRVGGGWGGGWWGRTGYPAESLQSFVGLNLVLNARIVLCFFLHMSVWPCLGVSSRTKHVFVCHASQGDNALRLQTHAYKNTCMQTCRNRHETLGASCNTKCYSTVKTRGMDLCHSCY